MSGEDEALLKALKGLTKKLSIQGSGKEAPDAKERPAMPDAEELSLKQKLRVLITMREPMENMIGIIEELEKLGTHLQPEYRLAQAHGLEEVAKRLEVHNDSPKSTIKAKPRP